MEQLALDLPRFMAASDKEKADTLLKIIGVGDRLAALDREIKAVFDRRTAIGPDRPAEAGLCGGKCSNTRRRRTNR